MKNRFLLRFVCLLMALLLLPTLPVMAEGEPAAQATETVQAGGAAGPMTLSSEEVHLGIKSNITLKIQYEDGAKAKKVVWTSSDKKVAKVTKGKVTGVAAGDCTITAQATMADGAQRTAVASVHVFRRITSMTLKPRTLVLPMGNAQQIALTIRPKTAAYQEVTWASSNPEIATVDEKGTITGVASGDAVITATSQEPARPGKKERVATCRVKVVAGADGVTIENPEPTGVARKGKLKLTAVVLPQEGKVKKIKWTSSDPKVAKINAKGIVTGMKEGTVTITATVQDGSNRADSREVHVYVPATSIKTTVEEKIQITQGDLYKIPVELKPAKATPSAVLWTTSDENVATVQDGEITAVGVGTCEIVAAANYGKGKALTFQVTVINATIPEAGAAPSAPSENTGA